MRDILDHCHNAPLQAFEPGAVLLSEGTTSGSLYVLKSGTVEVLRGETRVATVEDPGAVFGEMSVLLSLPHSATVRAVTPVNAHVFDDAESFMRSTPDAAFLVSRLLARRLIAATTYIADLKHQFEGHGDHLHMVGDVLDALIHHQEDSFSFAPEQESDPRL